MGNQVSATPSKLHAYSKAIVAANHDIQGAVASLASAVSTYNQLLARYSSSPQYANAKVLHGAPIPESIVGAAKAQLAAIQSTDERVGAVGSAFELADNGAGSGPVSVDATVLDHMLSEVNGRNLALLVTTDPKKVLDELRKNGGDPYYDVGFYNALDPEQRRLILSPVYDYKVIANTLAKAYGVGDPERYTDGGIDNTRGLDIGWTRTIADFFQNNWSQPDVPNRGTVFVDQLMVDLAKNATASGNFARTLSPDTAKIFLGSANAHDVGVRNNYLGMLTVGMTAMKPEEVRALIETVAAEGNFPTITPKAFAYTEPTLRRFLAMAAVSMIDPPPASGDQKELAQWRNQSQKDLGKLTAFNEWATLVDEGAIKNREWDTGAKITIAGEAIVGGAMHYAPEEIAFPVELGMHLLGSEGVYTMEKYITDQIYGNAPKSDQTRVSGFVDLVRENALAQRAIDSGLVEGVKPHSVSAQQLAALLGNDPSNSAYALDNRLKSGVLLSLLLSPHDPH